MKKNNTCTIIIIISMSLGGMNVMKKRILLIMTSLAVVGCISCGVMAYQNTNVDVNKLPENQKSTPSISLNREETEDEDVVENSTVIFGMAVDKSLEQIEQESSLVVYGTVVGKSDSYRLSTGYIYTDYYVQPTEILRGELAEGEDTITIPVLGGQIEHDELIDESGVDLSPGQTYLLFLHEPMNYMKELGYKGYVFTNVADSVYEIHEDSLVSQIDKRNEIYDNLITLEDVREDLDVINVEYPFSECHDREVEYVRAALKNNYEEGLITEEYYKECLQDYANE